MNVFMIVIVVLVVGLVLAWMKWGAAINRGSAVSAVNMTFFARKSWLEDKIRTANKSYSDDLLTTICAKGIFINHENRFCRKYPEDYWQKIVLENIRNLDELAEESANVL